MTILWDIFFAETSRFAGIDIRRRVSIPAMIINQVIKKVVLTKEQA
jgi:hypothetical protein